MSDLMPWMAPWSGRILALLLAVAGGFLLWRSLFHDRSRGRPRCPKCWYDATGLPSNTCPECGHTVTRQADRFRTRRFWRSAIIGLLIAVALPVFVVQRRVGQFGWQYYTIYGPVYYLFPVETMTQETFGDFVVHFERDRRHYLNDRGQSARVSHNGRTVFKKDGWRWWFYEATQGEQTISPGQDINNNGIPDIVFTEHSGGAHCCSTIFIFELSPARPHILAEVEARHGGDRFEDIDHDGDLELIVHDWTFAYWNTSFAGSPAPEVIFTYGKDSYEVSTLLRRKPSMPMDQLQQIAQKLKSALGADDGASSLDDHSELWGTMLDLIYSGNSDRAYAFLNETWPPERKGKTQFLNNFRTTLSTSPYRTTIEALGHPPLTLIEQEK